MLVVFIYSKKYVKMANIKKMKKYREHNSQTKKVMRVSLMEISLVVTYTDFNSNLQAPEYSIQIYVPDSHIDKKSDNKLCHL